MRMKPLLSADPSLLTWLCTSLSAGVPRLVELACSLSLSLSHQARLLEICNIVPGDYAAAICSRSGVGMFWT